MGFELNRRKYIGILMIFVIMLLCSSEAYQSLVSMPEHIQIVPGEDYGKELLTDLPIYLSVHRREIDDFNVMINGRSLGEAKQIFHTSDLTVSAAEPGAGHLEIRLLGILPFRNVAVEAVTPVEVMPGGQSIGVLLESAGVLVIEPTAVITDSGDVYPAREAGMRAGDLILAVNETPVEGKEHLAEIINNNEDELLIMTVGRNDDTLEVPLSPRFDVNEESYRIGLWVKDGTAGVGTLTAYDHDTRHYLALGHQIIEPQVRIPIPVRKGYIVSADVTDISTADRGKPGEKIGVFSSPDEAMGNVDANTPFGVVGHLWNMPSEHHFSEPLPVAFQHQVEAGPAEMITVIEGEEVRKFDVQIEETRRQNTPDQKGMVLRITDSDLLDKTGGIVQGMSGSPLIQNGKLVGAVTHVLMSDPKRGYGIYAEWLACEMGLLSSKNASARRSHLIGIAAFREW